MIKKNIVVIFIILFAFDGYSKEYLIGFPANSKSKIIAASKRIVTEAYRRLGHSVKLWGLPLSRSIAMADKGRLDAELVRIGGLSKNFKNLLQVSFPLLQMNTKVVTRDRNLKSMNISDLFKSSVVYRSGILKFEKLFEKHKNKREVLDSIQIFKMVKNKRVEFGVIVAEISQHLVKKEPFSKLKVIPTDDPTAEVFHYIHKKNKNLLPKMVEMLKQMKKEGFY
jgi:hypothetical protein